MLGSNVPGLAKGSVLADDALLDVPRAKSVRVIMKPANVTKVIAGPYKGTAKDYAPSVLATAGRKAQPSMAGTFSSTGSQMWLSDPPARAQRR